MLLYKKERRQYQEAIVDDISPSTVYGAEHLLRLFGKISVSSYSDFKNLMFWVLNIFRLLFFSSAVKLPELFSYVNMEEETWSRMQQTLLDFLKYPTYLSISRTSRFLGLTVKFTIAFKTFTGSFRRIRALSCYHQRTNLIRFQMVKAKAKTTEEICRYNRRRIVVILGFLQFFWWIHNCKVYIFWDL